MPKKRQFQQKKPISYFRNNYIFHVKQDNWSDVGNNRGVTTNTIGKNDDL